MTSPTTTSARSRSVHDQDYTVKWSDGLTTSPPTCLFCGSQKGPFDVEDVFAIWIRKVLPRPAIVIRNSDNSNRKPKVSTVLEAKLRKAVCKSCNGGWMSRLENAAKRVLSPMLNPKPNTVPVRLDLPAQQLVAYWAVHKSLCLELSLRQAMADYPWGRITRDEFTWMYDHRESREPPPGAEVFLFAFQAQASGSNQARVSSHRSVGLSHIENPERPVGCLSTTTIGTLGFQVFRHDIVLEEGVPRRPEPLMVPSNLRQVLIPIWPTVQPIAGWLVSGPAGVVSDSRLDNLWP